MLIFLYCVFVSVLSNCIGLFIVVARCLVIVVMKDNNRSSTLLLLAG